MKTGIFVDAENVRHNGGWGLRYDVLKDIIQKQGANIIRANVYMAIDHQREAEDPIYRQKKEDFRTQVRRCGFKIVLKEVRREIDEEGETLVGANTHLDLAIDVLVQGRHLDYVVLITGEGDLVRLVSALQNNGTRVDVISFHNTSRTLREAADYHCYGFLVPRLIPTESGRERGILYTVDEERYFGHISVLKSFQVYDRNVFCHGSEFEERLNNQEFANLKEQQAILEFNVHEGEKGPQARNIEILHPPHHGEITTS